MFSLKNLTLKGLRLQLYLPGANELTDKCLTHCLLDQDGSNNAQTITSRVFSSLKSFDFFNVVIIEDMLAMC